MGILSFLHMLRLPKPDYEVYYREKRLERFKKTADVSATCGSMPWHTAFWFRW